MKISIITAAYNSAKTLEGTLQSVLSQTYHDIEHIVVDGGSTDGTQDLIKRFEPLYGGRLRWISEKDNGIYDAMNKGLRMATGDVVGILNSDDYFTTPDVVAQVAETMADKTLDAVYGDIHFIRDGQPGKCIRYYSSKLFRPFCLRFGFMPAHPSFYCRREIFSKAGLYKTDYKIGSDYEMMVRLFMVHKIKARYIPYDFVTMRTGGASTRGMRSRMQLIKEDIRGCRENGVYTNALMISCKFAYKIFGLRL